MWFDRILTVIKYLIISLVFLFLFLLAAVNLPVSQRIITRTANNYFNSKKLPVQVEKITLLVTGRVGLRQPQIIIPSGDTLLNADQISVAIRIAPLIFKKLKVKAVTINQATVSLRKDSISGALNLVSLFSATTNPPQAKTNSGKKWQIEAESVKLKDVRFSFEDEGGGVKVWQSVGRLFVKLNSLSLNDKIVDVSEIDMESVSGGVELTNVKAPDEKQAANESSTWKFRLGKGNLKDIRFVLHQPDMKQRMEISLKRADISETTLTLADHTIMNAGIELQEPVAGIFSSSTESSSDGSKGIENRAGFPGPWSITGDDVKITGGAFDKGEYAAEAVINAGNSMLQVSDLNTAVQDLVLNNRESNINIERLSFNSGNGFELKRGEITFHSDSTLNSRLVASLETPSSMATLRFEAESDLTSLLSSFMSVPFSLSIDRTEISAGDILRFLPGLNEKISEEARKNFRITAAASITGTLEKMNLGNFALKSRSGATLSLKGEISNIAKPSVATLNIDLTADNITRNRLADLLSITGISTDLPDFEPLALEVSVRDSLLVPEFSLALNGGLGSVEIDGAIDIYDKVYDLLVACSGLELGSITGVSGLSRFSGNLDIDGIGFSPASMAMNASVSIDTAGFRGYDYRSVIIEVDGRNGSYSVAADANDPSFKCDLSGNIEFRDSLIRGSITGFFDIDAGRLNLYKDFSGRGTVEAYISRDHGDLTGSLYVNEMSVIRSGRTGYLDSLSIEFQSTDSLLVGKALTDFLRADAHFSGSVADLKRALSEGQLRGAALVDSAVGNKLPFLSVMPDLHLTADMVYDPFIDIFVNDSIFNYDRVSLELTKDTTGVATARMTAGRLMTGATSLFDTRLEFENHPDYSLLTVKSDSVRYGSIMLSDLAIDMTTKVDTGEFRIKAEDRESLLLYDIAGEVYKSGREIRLRSTLPSWIVNGFTWSISLSDFLIMEPWKKDFTADLHLKSDQHAIDIYGNKLGKIILELKEVDLNKLVIPGMDTFGADGILTGKIGYQGKDGMDLGINMNISELTLNDREVGILSVDGHFLSDTLGDAESNLLIVMNDTSRLSLDLMLGKSRGSRNIEAEFSGIPVDPFESFADKFISGLHGFVSGEVRLTSEDKKQRIDGSVEIRETGLRIKPLNASFYLPGDIITINNNRLTFNDFIILDSLRKQLSLNGTIDLADPENIIADLRVASDRMQLMNTSEKDNQAFYGSIFVNTGLNITGSLRNPSVEGKIVLAEGTVINYKYTEDLSVSETEKTIKFASLTQADTVRSDMIPIEKPFSNLPEIEALIEIDPKSLFNFQITRGFDIGVHITGGGFLTYSMMPNQATNLNGTYEIHQGSTELKIPGWPRKDFIITPGSYIRWDGKIGDPELRIETTSKVRGSYYNPVDQNNRVVNFLVYLKMTNRLAELDLVFDVRSEDQYVMSVINSMSADERMQQAINLLIFERIELPNSESSSDYVTQQISQFWESQLNQLTSSAIKGVDISFGLDTFTGVSDAGGKESYTSLTYEVKKAMFKDRGTLMVSGRMYENTPAGQSSNNLIENFIFEYSLDSARTKFLKVYRQQNYEDLLEGEVIKSGVGFIYRKNYDRLRDIWRRKTGDGRPEIEE
jgi:hypothetical protein